MNNRLSTTSRIITVICALSLIGVLFLPIWRIELSAPQYPEGLELRIYANKLGGDVEVVNGLNHYIGMRTLHEKDFFEFTVLPYIIGAFVLFGLITALVNRKWLFFTWVACFLLFALVALIDFYRWEYDYGHNLDPSAPIQVPGMSYQPPLIGYKQLLNFGAWSVPGAGGWIFTAAGVAMVLISWRELRRKNKKSFTNVKTALTTAAIFIMVFATSCSTGPQPIRFGKDACDFCKMTILDQRFGGEVITGKGKVYKFDDIHCISSFLRSDNVKTNVAGVYLLDYGTPTKFVQAGESFLLKSGGLHSPMGSNTAAFAAEANRQQVKQQVNGTNVQWNEINQ